MEGEISSTAEGLTTIPADIVEKLGLWGQNHLLAYWDSLDSTARTRLLEDIRTLDFAKLSAIFKESTAPAVVDDAPPFPVKNVCSVEERTEEEMNRWRGLGLQLIREGKVASLVLAGGQGTRLGSSAPKGCYDIGLPSHKSLFGLQAERILAAQERAAAEAGEEGCGARAVIPWYVMTSEFTHEPTVDFFRSHNFFGLSENQVMFFQQGTLPCFTTDGKLILEAPDKIARGPDGNGGIYAAMEMSGTLADLVKRGVDYIDCYSVDNALVRVVDPLFIGYCAEIKAACAAKVVKKAYPEERVGVFVHRGGEDGPVEIVEYSELDPALASSRDATTGELKFLWSNVCMHLFTTNFVAKAAKKLQTDTFYHIARKSIPSVDGPVPGIKLEQFIFDAFRLVPFMALFEVIREREFAPVKNAPGSATDSPEIARDLLLRLQ